MKTKQNGKGVAYYAAFLILVAVMFGGCMGAKMDYDSEPPEGFTRNDMRFRAQGLSAETARQIRYDYANHYFSGHNNVNPDDIEFDYFFRTYNGWVVMAYQRKSYTQDNFFIPVAGFDFFFREHAFMFAWKNGQIYDVEEAFEKGFLTRGNIRTMYNLHRQGGTR